jgi:hypothetical protein
MTDDEGRAAIMAGRPNDTTILAAAATGRPDEYVILADRGPREHDRFVTARMWPDRLTSWQQGSYHADLLDAVEDYRDRAGIEPVPDESSSMKCLYINCHARAQVIVQSKRLCHEHGREYRAFLKTAG